MVANPRQTEEYMRHLEKITRWDTRVSVALENGMFEVKMDKVDEIFAGLKRARESIEIDIPNFAECSYELNKASQKYYDVLKSKDRLWRLKNVYAVHHLFYLIFFLLLVFLFYYFGVDTYLSENFNIPILGIQATTWGIVGSILRGLWALWRKVDDRMYRNAWLISFTVAPFIGGILGALVYFLVFAGLIVVSSAGSDGSALELNFMVIIALSAFAGYNWDWAVKQLEKLQK